MRPAEESLGVLFAFAEDGTVEVLDDPEAAQQYEPVDVENQVFVFYAEDGCWMEPHFTKPNRPRLFGLTLEPGWFKLVRNPAGDASVDPFEVALDNAAVLEPNRHFQTLDMIRRHVECCRLHGSEGGRTEIR